jgi:hypothetical protein
VFWLKKVAVQGRNQQKYIQNFQVGQEVIEIDGQPPMLSNLILFDQK